MYIYSIDLCGYEILFSSIYSLGVDLEEVEVGFF